MSEKIEPKPHLSNTELTEIAAVINALRNQRNFNRYPPDVLPLVRTISVPDRDDPYGMAKERHAVIRIQISDQTAKPAQTYDFDIGPFEALATDRNKKRNYVLPYIFKGTDNEYALIGFQATIRDHRVTTWKIGFYFLTVDRAVEETGRPSFFKGLRRKRPKEAKFKEFSFTETVTEIEAYQVAMLNADLEELGYTYIGKLNPDGILMSSSR